MAPRQLRQSPNSSNLYDILDLILDKGIVIDAYVRVSLVGIELLTVDARVVIASVDTFIRYSQAMDQLGTNVNERFDAQKLPDMVRDGVADHAINRGKEQVKEAVVGGDGASRTVMGSMGKGVRTAAKTAGTAALAIGAEKLAEKITKRRNGAPPEPDESPDDDDDVEAFDEEESPEEEPQQAPERRRRRKRRV